MKRHILILAILLTACVGQGQTNVYHPFPDSAYWRVDEYYDQPFQINWCFVNYYYHYYTLGDTLINSFVHKKMYRSFELVSIQSCSPYGVYHAGLPAGYAGALKDDSIANKTFFVFPNTSTDSLLYDYNLNVGDTMKGFVSQNPNSYYKMVVLSKDSVLINGNYRKKWSFSPIYGGTNPYIIEGIGSSAGLIEPIETYALDFTFRYLVCVKDSSGILFSSAHNSAMGCNLITGLKEINADFSFKFFPNPFSEQTTLQTDKFFKNATLTIFNSFGQQVKQINNISGKTLILHRENLPGGIYFLRLMQDNEILMTEKLVITDN